MAVSVSCGSTCTARIRACCAVGGCAPGRLAKHRFTYKGKSYPLSTAAVDTVVKVISSTGLSEGLIPANKAIYIHLTKGITVTEFVDGHKTSVTVPLVDWGNVDANDFHVTEELSVERPAGLGRYRPDIIGYVNGIPIAVIEAKRPVSSSKDKPMVAEGISQHLRNQMGDGIQDLYAYSQVLLSISGTDAQYATTATPAKFWAIWREEDLSATEMGIYATPPLRGPERRSLCREEPC